MHRRHVAAVQHTEPSNSCSEERQLFRVKIAPRNVMHCTLTLILLICTFWIGLISARDTISGKSHGLQPD